MAVQGLVFPPDPASVVGGDPIDGLAVSAPPAVEIPLVGAAVEFVGSKLVTALLALFLTQHCRHVSSSLEPIRGKRDRT
jgi:hypothetical protein